MMLSILTLPRPLIGKNKHHHVSLSAKILILMIGKAEMFDIFIYIFQGTSYHLPILMDMHFPEKKTECGERQDLIIILFLDVW